MTGLLVVDAFTSVPFAGNPAAVCVLSGPADEQWMQLVAREMNLSETAFVHRENAGFRLRWFTPETEVELCGHATLAAAHVLWQEGHLDAAAAAQFLTRSGPLAATRDGDWITLDFPVTPVVPVAWPDGLVDVLGCTPVFVGRSMFDLLVLLDSEQAVRALHPALDRVRSYPYRGLIVTAPGERVDVVSRFFAPAVGVPEDPVTGSAHCALAPFWCERLQRDSLLCEQFSPHRGGQLRARLRGDRVALAGQAVTTARVQLLV